MEGTELYQALEALYAIREVLAQDAMNFFAMFSGYLVASYLVGEKFTTSQLIAVTSLYSVFSAGPIVGVYVAVVDLQLIPVGLRVIQLQNPYFIPTIMVLGWALSIAFMLDIRRRAKNAGDAEWLSLRAASRLTRR